MESTTEQKLRPEEIKSLNSWLFFLLKEGAGPEDNTTPNDEDSKFSTWQDVDIVRVLRTIDENLGLAFRKSFSEGRIISSEVWNHLYQNQPHLIVIAIKNGGFATVESFL